MQYLVRSMGHEYLEKELMLLHKLTQGDAAAFDDLFWLYQRAIFQNVLKFTKDPVMAEDILQEVFISLWEKRNTIDTTRSVGGWLFIASYHRAVTALKKKTRESRLVHEAVDQLVAEENENLRELQFSILERAIDSLSGQKKKVFELCKLQGYSYEEAASALGISKHTVKEYLSAAMQQVRAFARDNPAGLGTVLFFLFLG